MARKYYKQPIYTYGHYHDGRAVVCVFTGLPGGGQSHQWEAACGCDADGTTAKEQAARLLFESINDDISDVLTGDERL